MPTARELAGSVVAQRRAITEEQKKKNLYNATMRGVGKDTAIHLFNQGEIAKGLPKHGFSPAEVTRRLNTENKSAQQQVAQRRLDAAYTYTQGYSPRKRKLTAAEGYVT